MNNKMKLTKREKFMLFQALEFEIHRYLMSNTFGREDPIEKAERHMNISRILVGFVICTKYIELKHFEIMHEVHDYLAEVLTDKMDEVIDFPIYEKIYDYDEYVLKFFNVIIDHINEVEKLIKDIIRRENYK